MVKRLIENTIMEKSCVYLDLGDGFAEPRVVPNSKGSKLDQHIRLTILHICIGSELYKPTKAAIERLVCDFYNSMEKDLEYALSAHMDAYEGMGGYTIEEIYAENEPQIIAYAEGDLFLTLRNNETPHEKNKEKALLSLLGRIQDHEARSEIFMCKDALKMLMHKVEQIGVNYTVLKNYFDFHREIEKGVFDDLLEGVANIAAIGRKFSSIELFPKGETPVIGESAGTA